MTALLKRLWARSTIGDVNLLAIAVAFVVVQLLLLFLPWPYGVDQ